MPQRNYAIGMAEKKNAMEELESIVKCEPTPKPVTPDPRAEDKKLLLRYNMAYIVAAVLFDGEKVLLIQEAKPSCRGDWYLPAGRMEANETIVEAVKREVEEESGLTFEPEAVIAAEAMSYMWIRVTLTGRVTGGSLKTTAQADKESLQAGWFSKEELKRVHLRATDICPLIEIGRKWAGGKKYGGLPVQLGHVGSSLRLVLVTRDHSQLKVLVRREGKGLTTHFPVMDIPDAHYPIDRGLTACGYKGGLKVSGVLSLEHLGRPHGTYDGMCVSVLLEASTQDLDSSSDYMWTPVDQKLEKQLRDALDNHCAELIRHK